jgi:hypothetical protein
MTTRNVFWGCVSCGIVGVLLAAGAAWARPGGLPQCLNELNTCTATLTLTQATLATCTTHVTTCTTDLTSCEADLTACLAEPTVVFPGDGAGHGPELSYTDNGDGTATDNNTALIWELKDNNGGIHDVDNTYTWSSAPTAGAADGTLFTVFLATLNTPPCFAGHCDWRIPHVKELQSLVDYESGHNPSISPTFPGLTAGDHWSSTRFGGGTAWAVNFGDGSVFRNAPMQFGFHGRAVRGGS